MKKNVLYAIVALVGLGLSGCGDDLFVYADEDSYTVNTGTNVGIGVDLESGGKVDTEDASPNDNGNAFYLTKPPENGSAMIDGNILIYEPDYNFKGLDKVEVSQGKEEDIDYRIIYISFAVGQGLEAPTIGGTPTTQVSTNQGYSFTPSISKDPAKTYRYSVANKPSWLSFNSTNGQLSGTSPSFGGEYVDVTISVNDGVRSSSLEPFTITVTEQSASDGGGTLG